MRAFLRAHWDAIAACDFFTVEVLTWTGLTLVLLGENHLRTAVREYAAHYHTERNHQGLDGRLLEPPANDSGTGPIDCRERLGGLLRFYHRQAA